MLEVQVGIDLRGADIGVAEQFLHRAQVLRRLQQMAGEAVAQHVRMQALAQLAGAGSLHPFVHRALAETAALLADEYRAVGRIGQRPQRQPGAQRLARLASYRQLTLLVALADDSYQPGGQVEPVEIQTDQLGQAQPGGIEQLEHGLVATGDEVVLDSTVQQLHRAIGVQQPRQALLALGRADAAGWIMRAEAFLIEVAIQSAQRRQQTRQAAAGQSLAMQFGNQLAHLLAAQRRPLLHRLALAEGEHSGQIAAVAVQGMRRHLSLAVQVLEIAIEIGLHGASQRWPALRRPDSLPGNRGGSAHRA